MKLKINGVDIESDGACHVEITVLGDQALVMLESVPQRQRCDVDDAVVPLSSVTKQVPG